ncbi:MAG: hypothetical protein U0T81_10370 [Saprospiraceae bacterium]
MHLVTIAMIRPNESTAIDIRQEDILIDALLGIGAKKTLGLSNGNTLLI